MYVNHKRMKTYFFTNRSQPRQWNITPHRLRGSNLFSFWSRLSSRCITTLYLESYKCSINRNQMYQKWNSPFNSQSFHQNKKSHHRILWLDIGDFPITVWNGHNLTGTTCFTIQNHLYNTRHRSNQTRSHNNKKQLHSAKEKLKGKFKAFI